MLFADIDEIIDGTGVDKDTNVITNADRIRAMSDEELISSFFLEDKCPENISRRECNGFESCKDCWIHWFKQPAEGECP